MSIPITMASASGKPKAPAQERGGDEGDAHLQQPRQQGLPPTPTQLFEGKLEADLEEQEGDAELGDLTHPFRVLDPGEAAGSHHRAGE